MKAVVAAFNQEKALVGASSVIVKSSSVQHPTVDNITWRFHFVRTLSLRVVQQRGGRGGECLLCKCSTCNKTNNDKVKYFTGDQPSLASAGTRLLYKLRPDQTPPPGVVLHTIHRFHIRFSQTRRRPLLGPSPG